MKSRYRNKNLHPIFLPMAKKTWSLKRLRFIPLSSGASCTKSVLHTPTAVLHKTPFQMKHLLLQIWSSFISFRYEALFRFTPQYEAFASLILWENEKMRVLRLQYDTVRIVLFCRKEITHHGKISCSGKKTWSMKRLRARSFQVKKIAKKHIFQQKKKSVYPWQQENRLYLIEKYLCFLP